MQVYNSSNFNLDLAFTSNKLELTQQVFHTFINTEDLPSTQKYLSLNLPTIFNSRCFNPKKLSFFEEVKKTEIGHLLEHLILEYLKLSVAKQSSCNIFNGVTCWNYSKYGFGKYFITITPNQFSLSDFVTSVYQASHTLDDLYNLHTPRQDPVGPAPHCPNPNYSLRSSLSI